MLYFFFGVWLYDDELFDVKWMFVGILLFDFEYVIGVLGVG